MKWMAFVRIGLFAYAGTLLGQMGIGLDRWQFWVLMLLMAGVQITTSLEHWR